MLWPLVPFFLLPARYMGRRLAGLAHEQMVLNADLGTRMTERFNVAGALLVKLFGRPATEDDEYALRAGQVRDIGVRIALNRSIFFVALTLVASLATAMIYGVGGVMAVDGTLTVGTLLALTALLARLYGPLTAISNVRVDVMTALVSFERVFEVLDLQPLVAEAPDARPVPGGPVRVDVEGVSFSYPSADEVSLASLESLAQGDRRGGGPVLRDVSFSVEPGTLVALVGPSGAGKTTITALVARLYDPTAGSVRSTASTCVTRRSSRCTTPSASSRRRPTSSTTRSAPTSPTRRRGPPRTTWSAPCAPRRCGRSWTRCRPGSTPSSVTGDTGCQEGRSSDWPSPGCSSRAPGSSSSTRPPPTSTASRSRPLQKALDEALRDRTALVIAHRLSTVRHADLILVVDDGRIVERGTHAQLVAAGGLYAELYKTQFSEELDEVLDVRA